MNNFCKSLLDSLREEFEIEVDIFVKKKKRNLYTCLY